MYVFFALNISFTCLSSLSFQFWMESYINLIPLLPFWLLADDRGRKRPPLCWPCTFRSHLPIPLIVRETELLFLSSSSCPWVQVICMSHYLVLPSYPAVSVDLLAHISFLFASWPTGVTAPLCVTCLCYLLASPALSRFQPIGVTSPLPL